jgi:DNA-binding MarR family transcriptional regulator
MAVTENWTDDFHRTLLSISGAMNDPRVDAEFLKSAGVSLERVLFPLLARLGSSGPMSTGKLADLLGRDHSTVSRQTAKLEKRKLVRRVSTDDRRMRLLEPTSAGVAILTKLAEVRRHAIERHFADWTIEDRNTLFMLLDRAVKNIHTLFLNHEEKE